MIDNVKIYNLTVYVSNLKTKDIDVFTIFNNWTALNHIEITNYDEAMWALNHIKEIQKMDKSILQEAQVLDEKQILYERNGAYSQWENQKAIMKMNN